MRKLTVTTAAILTLGLGMAPGTVFAQQTQQPSQPQQVAPGLIGGGGSSKPNQYQSGSDSTSPPGLLGGGSSTKPNQYQSGSESTSPPGLLGGGGSTQPNQAQGGGASSKKP